MESIIIIQQDIEENDLTYWEFINNSDIVSDGNGSIDTFSLDSFPSCNSSLSSSPTTKTPTNNNNNTQNPLQDLTHEAVHGHDLEEHIKYDVGFPYVEEQVKYDVGFPYFNHQHHDVGVDDDEEEEEKDEENEELDDELVPWHLSGKLGRNRMRKLGKRACSKITSAKRNPYRYVKPGCVHGKHGLGLKGSC